MIIVLRLNQLCSVNDLRYGQLFSMISVYAKSSKEEKKKDILFSKKVILKEENIIFA
jgi:hypothetical protein